MSTPRISMGTEVAAAVLLATVATICLVWLIPSHTQPPMSDADLSPALFPTIAASLVLLLSVGMAVHRLRRPSDEAGELGAMTILLELFIWGLAATAIGFALPALGFVPVAIAIVLLGGIVTGYRQWWVIAPLAVGFAVVVDLGAWQFFTVDLP